MTINDDPHETTMIALREAALSESSALRETPECMTDEMIVAFADGAVRARDRIRWVKHLSSCRRCQRNLGSLARALNDPDVASAVSKNWMGIPRMLAVAVPAAAAVVLFVFLTTGPDRQHISNPQHRAPILTAAVAPVGLSPSGTVSRLAQLEWSGVPRADLYRVTLFDTNGRVLFESNAEDTSVALPDSVGLVPSQRYLWQVKARTGFDRWVSSDLVEFKVIPELP